MFEEYQDIARLGGKGDVWLVLHEETKKVFVKKYRTNFTPEVYESISRIQNIHIPKIVACQERDGVLCLIEEYIGGETMLEKMEQGYIFTEKETKKLMLQLCEALECLHIRFKPIIHRDIKPSNIMISDDGILKLIDYDAARCYEEGACRDTAYMGTPGFAAPEQHGFGQTDVRTDIYAQGVVLNYMLTGSPPDEKMAGGKWKEIVETCVQMDPEKRFGSVGDVKEKLGRVEVEKYRKREPVLPSCQNIVLQCIQLYVLLLFMTGWFLISILAPFMPVIKEKAGVDTTSGLLDKTAETVGEILAESFTYWGQRLQDQAEEFMPVNGGGESKGEE